MPTAEPAAAAAAPRRDPLALDLVRDEGASQAERLAAMAERRSRCPVAAVSGPGGPAAVSDLAASGPWYVASYAGAVEALRAVERFEGGVGSSDAPEELRTFNGLPEPRHGQVRRLVNGLIAAHWAKAVEPTIRQLCERLGDDLVAAAAAAGDEGVEVMGAFVDPVPPATVAALIGWDTDDPVQLFRWTNEITARAMEMSPGSTLSMADLCPPFRDAVDERIDERLAADEATWPDDGLSLLLRAELDGRRISRTYVRTQLMFLLGAGSETTRNLIGNLLHQLAVEPALLARLRADRSLVAGAVEEALRARSPTQFLVRRCTSAVDVAGHPVGPGEQVVIGLTSANHDGAVFEDPERFDPARANARSHLAFGSGPHVCPGAAVARRYAQLAIEAFLDRFDAAEVVPGGYERFTTPMFDGPRVLRLRLRRAGDAL
jgi:cytochrome P450